MTLKYSDPETLTMTSLLTGLSIFRNISKNIFRLNKHIFSLSMLHSDPFTFKKPFPTLE